MQTLIDLYEIDIHLDIIKIVVSAALLSVVFMIVMSYLTKRYTGG